MIPRFPRARTPMQRRPWIAAGLCFLTLALAGCHREQSDWAKARAANTVQSYEQYLAKYPNGSFATQAQARLAQAEEDQDWQKAGATNTPEGYQAFLRQHPQGKWAEEARIRIENFALASPPNAPTPNAGVPPTSTAAAGDTTGGTATATGGAKPAAPAAAHPAAAHRTTAHRAVRHERSGGAYWVQLGAFRSGTAAALRHWRVIAARDRRLLRGLHPRVSPLHTKTGRLYRLQVHGLSAARAALICRRLHAHAQACIVLRPQGR